MSLWIFAANPIPSQSRDFYREAALSFAAGDLAAVDASLNEAEQREGPTLRLWLEKAAVREEAGDAAGAAECYAHAAFLAGDPLCQSEAAISLARRGDVESLSRAVTHLDDVLGEFPDLPEPVWDAAYVHRALARRAKVRSQEAKLEWGRARDLFETFTVLDPFSGAAYMLLGECDEALGDHKGAQAAFEKALRIEPSFRKLHGRLARLLKGAGDLKGALARYERATAVNPSDIVLQREKQSLQKTDPDMAQERRQTRRAQWLVAEPPDTTPLPDSPVTVRVGLENNLRRLVFRGRGELVLNTPAGTVIRTLEGGCDFEVSWKAAEPEGKKIPPAGPWPEETPRSSPTPTGTGMILDAQGNTLVTFDQRIWIRPADPVQSVALHAVASGSGYFFATEQDRFYRGVIEIHPGPGSGFNVINRVSMENYVAGVLPSEMPASWPLEALKAQAVAARTDGLAKVGRHRSAGYDVCDEVHCQAYGGVKVERPSTNQAVSETAGKVLWRNGRPFPAYYSAQCGGHTQDVQEAWGYDQAVAGVPDFDKKRSPGPFPLSPRELKDWILRDPDAFCSVPALPGYRNFRWMFHVTAGDLESKESLKPLGRLKGVRVTARSKAGWAIRVLFTGEKGEKVFSGDSIRGILGGLRSNLLWLETWPGPDGNLDEVVIYGGGWGHGVGMCQVGAYGLARSGKKWKQILKHYYPKASIKGL